MEKTGVAIVGLGNVGAGVARILLDHGDRTTRHAGRTLWLTHVVVRDTRKPRDVDLPAGVLTADLDRLIADDQRQSGRSADWWCRARPGDHAEDSRKRQRCGDRQQSPAGRTRRRTV